ncbi:hypothetical protein MPLSOD_280050 [Mesorhizobium sp. SOD10]|nr:hypothetical protein MPLSOD_280050 [Mesorhizobium sp. SOD10]
MVALRERFVRNCIISDSTLLRGLDPAAGPGSGKKLLPGNPVPSYLLADPQPTGAGRVARGRDVSDHCQAVRRLDGGGQSS